jgi:hypothetical protein
MRYQMARPQLFREPLATLLKNLEKEEGSAR